MFQPAVKPPSELDLDWLVATPLPKGFDPLADGILMRHQINWLEDKSWFKICRKGRRTGITFAEALDDVLIASASRSAGGDNVFYIGDTKEKGREFINTCADFARTVAKASLDVEEFLFEDKREDGESKYINAFRIRFASGFSIVALSSRPENIRGLQGVVVIDEAAFHGNVKLVLEAVTALLIWGGKVRIISSLNGEDNPFEELCKEAEAGTYGVNVKVHRITFRDAVLNGLYERVCLIKGWEPSTADKRSWYLRIIKSYGNNHEGRDQELFCIPARSSGVYFPPGLVKSVAIDDVPIARIARDDAWALNPERLQESAQWFADEIMPVIEALPKNKRTVFGQDFAMDGDLSLIWVLQENTPGHWRTVLVIEMRKISGDAQKQILFALMDELPMFHHGALDARGNGQLHAQAALQYKPGKITCIKATLAWYAEWFPSLKQAYEARTMLVANDNDLIADHSVPILVRGNPTMSGRHTKGKDGKPRHGDGVIGALLAWFSTFTELRVYEYHPIGTKGSDGGDQDDDDRKRPVRITAGIKLQKGIL